MAGRRRLFPPDFLDAIEAHDAGAWTGTVWRHLFGDNPPDLANRRGARWNPAGVAAIYVSFARETALAEADHAIAMQPCRPRVERRVHEILVSVERVVDLTDMSVLAILGVTPQVHGGVDMSPCQRVGEAVSWLGYGGLMVPSARAGGSNLVIY